MGTRVVRIGPYVRPAVDVATVVIAAVTVVISAIGLRYAARAATASERTVRLTREMQIGADVRHVLDALWGVERAAHDLTLVPTSLDHHRIFRDRQSVLARSASASLPLPDDVRRTLDRLVIAEPTDDPERIVTEAKQLWTRLSRERLTDAA